jgi:hypothetical protein
MINRSIEDIATAACPAPPHPKRSNRFKAHARAVNPRLLRGKQRQKIVEKKSKGDKARDQHRYKRLRTN